MLKAQRDNFDALHLLGMLNHQRGKAGEAYRLITAALKVQPRSPDALSNLALVLHALKRSDEALASLDKALALAPGHLDALNNRGNVLLDLKRPAEAVAAFDAVLAQAPRHVQALINRGNARAAMGEAEPALADYDAALAVAPGHPLALYNRGNALRALGREQDALAAYDGALAAAPNHPNAWANRGMALAALNRHSDALASYGRALALQPDNADVHFNAALSLLTIGDYPRGLAEYEWRWKRAGMGARKDLRQPLWLGETPLAGKTILLHAEQGLGDTMMFARYAPLLARTGARVVLEVQPELKGLLAGLEGVAAIVARGEPLPPFDVHCPLTSLPFACKTELSSVPADIPYLHASEAPIAKWRPRLDAVPPPRVALAWSGRATHVNDRNRSLSLSQLEPLLERRRRALCQHPARAASGRCRTAGARAAHHPSRRRACRLHRHRGGAGARRSRDLRGHLDRPCRRRARPAGLCAAAVPAGLALDARSRYAARGIRRCGCSASPRPATGRASSRRCASSSRCWTSGSPPCRPTSLRGAGGTPSASRRTAGRRCAATPRRAAPAAG